MSNIPRHESKQCFSTFNCICMNKNLNKYLLLDQSIVTCHPNCLNKAKQIAILLKIQYATSYSIGSCLNELKKLKATNEILNNYHDQNFRILYFKEHIPGIYSDIIQNLIMNEDFIYKTMFEYLVSKKYFLFHDSKLSFQGIKNILLIIYLFFFCYPNE